MLGRPDQVYHMKKPKVLASMVRDKRPKDTSLKVSLGDFYEVATA